MPPAWHRRSEACSARVHRFSIREIQLRDQASAPSNVVSQSHFFRARDTSRRRRFRQEQSNKSPLQRRRDEVVEAAVLAAKLHGSRATRPPRQLCRARVNRRAKANRQKQAQRSHSRRCRASDQSQKCLRRHQAKREKPRAQNLQPRRSRLRRQSVQGAALSTTALTRQKEGRSSTTFEASARRCTLHLRQSIRFELE